ncbi:hypothetical protein D3C78_1570400 [compost metagenome]
MRGDYHHPHPGREDAHLGEHVQAVVLAEAQVEETQVEHLAFQQGFGLGGAAGGSDAIAFVLQAITEGTQNRSLIVDEKNSSLLLVGLHSDSSSIFLAFS